jgi:hypothetical protein
MPIYFSFSESNQFFENVTFFKYFYNLSIQICYLKDRRAFLFKVKDDFSFRLIIWKNLNCNEPETILIVEKWWLLADRKCLATRSFSSHVSDEGDDVVGKGVASNFRSNRQILKQDGKILKYLCTFLNQLVGGDIYTVILSYYYKIWYFFIVIKLPFLMDLLRLFNTF